MTNMGQYITLAAGPQVKDPVVQGTKDAIGQVASNPELAALGKFLGGVLIALIAIALICVKWFPQGGIGQTMAKWKGGGIVAMVCGLLLGIFLIVPVETGSFIVAVLMLFVQFGIDLFCKIFNINV